MKNVVLALALLPCALLGAATEEGFVPLFNGRDLSGWEGAVTNGRFRVDADGTLVCATGHIHTMLLISGDGGKTWSEPLIVDPCDGKWDRSPSGYTSVFECEPGVLSLVWDDPKEGIAEGREPGKVRQVYQAKIKIMQ